MTNQIEFTTLSSAQNQQFENLILERVGLNDERLQALLAAASGVPVGTIPAPGPVSNKYELAQALSAQLDAAFLAKPSLAEDPGLWNALTLIWIEFIWGKGTEHRSEYFVFRASGRDRYRHRLAGPYFLLKRFGAAGKASSLLKALAHTAHGELLEQLLSRQYVFISDAAWMEAADLYLNGDSIKRGALGKGQGSVRRFGIVMQQIAVTYDTALLDKPGLNRLLPGEFDRFRA